MPATKTHPACTAKKECDYLKGWIKNGHIRKNLTQNGEPQLGFICWLVGCLTSQQHASESQGRICTEFYVLPHWDRSCRSSFLPHPVTVYWHPADQSQRWPYDARRLAGWPLECQFLSHWYDSTRKNPVANRIRTPDLPLPIRTQ